MAPSNHVRLFLRARAPFWGAPARSRLTASPMLLTPHSPSHQHRSFHLYTYINAGCQTAQDAIVALHSVTGLSWGLTIPLVAVGVNLVSRLPFNIYTSRLLQRRSQIAPVQQGWFMKLWQDAIKEKVPPEQMKKEVEKRAKSQTKRLYRALGLQQWKMFLVLLGFPFWITSLEAVRRISGWSRGLQVNTKPDGNPAASTLATHAPPASLPDTAHATGSVSANAVGTSPDAAAVADLPATAAQILDPALASDGMLWFTDLTAADPYYILPTCFTVLLVTNLIPRDEAAKRKVFGQLYTALKRDKQSPQSQAPSSLAPPDKVEVEADWRVRLLRSVMVSSPILLVLTSSFPAAMHLYTIPSLLTTMATKFLLSKKYPAEEQVKSSKLREFTVIRPPLAKSQDQSSEK